MVGILDYSGKVYLQMTEQQDAKRPQSLGTLQRRAAIADRLSEGRNRYSEVNWDLGSPQFSGSADTQTNALNP